MDHMIDFATVFGPAVSEDRLVYVRPVDVADLPDVIREQLGDLGTIWSVNRPDGERLALVRERGMAFDLARHNDFAPVSTH